MSKGKGEPKGGLERETKKFQKPLDKTTKVWYNKYEKRKENLIKPERDLP